MSLPVALVKFFQCCRGTFAGHSSQVHRYLDSADLYASWSHLEDGLRGYLYTSLRRRSSNVMLSAVDVGIEASFGSDHDSKSFSGIVFSLSTDELILLDRRSQCVNTFCQSVVHIFVRYHIFRYHLGNSPLQLRQML